jgi:hypothetical protein
MNTISILLVTLTRKECHCEVQNKSMERKAFTLSAQKKWKWAHQAPGNFHSSYKVKMKLWLSAKSHKIIIKIYYALWSGAGFPNWFCPFCPNYRWQWKWHSSASPAISISCLIVTIDSFYMFRISCIKNANDENYIMHCKMRTVLDSWHCDQGFDSRSISMLRRRFLFQHLQVDAFTFSVAVPPGNRFTVKYKFKV